MLCCEYMRTFSKKIFRYYQHTVRLLQLCKVENYFRFDIFCMKVFLSSEVFMSTSGRMFNYLIEKVYAFYCNFCLLLTVRMVSRIV